MSRVFLGQKYLLNDCISAYVFLCKCISSAYRYIYRDSTYLRINLRE